MRGSRARRARVGVADGAGRRLGRLAPIGDDAVVGAFVGDVDLGAQLVETQPLGELGGLARRRSRARSRARRAGQPDDEEIEQDLALRRQQGGVARLVRRKLFDVVGDHALQQRRRVGAGDPDDSAIAEPNRLSHHAAAPVSPLARVRDSYVGRWRRSARKTAQ